MATAMEKGGQVYMWDDRALHCAPAERGGCTKTARASGHNVPRGPSCGYQESLATVRGGASTKTRQAVAAVKASAQPSILPLNDSKDGFELALP